MNGKIEILDVGHGNCAVVHEADEVFSVVDGGCGSFLLDHLDDHGSPPVKNLLVSHSHADHLAGALSLLTSRRHRVSRLFVNPDHRCTSELWTKFRIAVAVARRNGTEVVPSLTSSTAAIEGVMFTVQVLSPLPENELGGPGTSGQTANTVSAVIRIMYADIGQALLPADMDHMTLDALIEEGTDLRARLLVFPHHGGRPGHGHVDAGNFAERLTRATLCERVVFSIGRHHPTRNPLPAVVAGVRRVSNADLHISCTQMSRHCLPEAGRQLYDDRCAGSVRITFPAGIIFPTARDHLEFIALATDGGPTLCLSKDPTFPEDSMKRVEPPPPLGLHMVRPATEP